jgi:cobalamin biosynthesis protein CbiD
MDEVVRKVAALGLPGVLLVITMAATGFAGAAAITTALATLGGPFGMMGGIAVLGITGLVADALGKYGIDGLLTGIYMERKKKEPKEKLCKEINDLAISSDLKRKLREIIACS